MATKVTGWFPHDIDTIDDVDIQLLIDELGPTAYAIWWRIVETLHKHGGSMQESRLMFIVDKTLGIKTTQLTTCNAELVVMQCISLGLLTFDDGFITSERVMRNLDFRKDVSAKRSEAGRRGGLSKSQAIAKQVPSKDEAKTSTVTYTVTDTVTEEKKHSRKSVSAFAPPTLDEVIEFFDEHSQADHLAPDFFNHYESVGWKVGNKPMKDWKAASRRWFAKGPTPKQIGTFVASRWPDRIDGTNPELRFAQDFFKHYAKQGWKLGNGNAITDWKLALIEWVDKAMKDTP